MSSYDPVPVSTVARVAFGALVLCAAAPFALLLFAGLLLQERYGDLLDEGWFEPWLDDPNQGDELADDEPP